MIRSMTGYGDAERDTPAGRLRVEVRTVNHRFFNASLRTPSGFDRIEPEILAALKELIARGHVNLHLSIDRNATGEGTRASVDIERARRYKEALESVQAELAVPGAVDLSMLARFGDIFREPEAESGEVQPEVVREVVAEAAAAAVRLRETEGARLRDDMLGRVEAMEAGIERIERLAPERLRSERDRLRDAVRELSEDVDEERLAREIAYLAERWSIDEEIVRFRSHLEELRAALGPEPADPAAGGGGDRPPPPDPEGTGRPARPEPVGKRLGFLVQELHREANTIASKANDAGIAGEAVALRGEIERLREQVENVE